MSMKLVAATILAGMLAGVSSPASAAGPLPVALKGQPAPLVGYSYSGFDAVDVSDDPARTVAVIARMISKTALPHRVSCVVTLTSAGTATAQACTGNPVPGGGTVFSLNHLAMSPAGRVVYDARVKGAAHGIFADALAPVSRAGDPFPGGGSMNSINYPVATRTEGTVFKAYLKGVDDDTDEAIVRCVGGDGNCSTGTGAIQTLVRTSDPVVDQPGRLICDLMEFDATDFGIAFAARTKSACGANEASVIGVFRMSFGGGVQTIAMEGAPADPAGTTYDALDDRPSLDEVGFLTFRSEPPELPRSPRIFLCDPVACPAAKAVPVAIKGTLDDTGKALGGYSEAVLGPPGELVFAAKYTGGCGIFVRRADGEIAAVQRKGDVLASVGGALQCGLLPSMSPGGKIVFIDNVQPLPRGSRYVGVFLVE